MTIKDQAGYQVDITKQPQKIISLVPSQTELLFDLGLDNRIAGITRYCDKPHDKTIHKPVVGGTKDIDMEVIHKLAPDLIIGNKEENDWQQIMSLKKKYPVWLSDISSLEDSLLMIGQTGKITGCSKKAGSIVHAIRKGIAGIKRIPSTNAAYLVWKDPWIAAGGSTLIHDLMSRCGLQNIFTSYSKYPRINHKQLEPASIILLSSEPFPFRETHVATMQKQFPAKKIILIDGAIFSWYGSRLRYFKYHWEELKKEIEK